MVHTRVKFRKAAEYGGDPYAKEFEEMIFYPINNNLAERAVRPFTTKRKCSLHFGSDEGVEMSAEYHNIISTLKLIGKSVRDFFGDFFRCKVPGLDTYKEYLPALTR